MSTKTKILITTQAVVYLYIMYSATANLLFISILSILYALIGTVIISQLVEEVTAYLRDIFGGSTIREFQKVEPAKIEEVKVVEFIPTYKERLLMLATEAVEDRGVPPTRDAVMGFIRSRGVSVPNAHWGWMKKSIKPKQFPSL
jgi:hypothetical protein